MPSEDAKMTNFSSFVIPLALAEVLATVLIMIPLVLLFPTIPPLLTRKRSSIGPTDPAPPLAVVVRTLVRPLQPPYSTFDDAGFLKLGFIKGFLHCNLDAAMAIFICAVKGLHSKREGRNID